jgi:hypothetical protein
MAAAISSLRPVDQIMDFSRSLNCRNFDQGNSRRRGFLYKINAARPLQNPQDEFNHRGKTRFCSSAPD